MPTRTERLILALESSWSLETTSNPDEWTQENPARGQCVPTSLVVQDYLGGGLERLATEYCGVRETHYRNLIDGGPFDQTRPQYPAEQPFEPAPLPGDLREYVLGNLATRERYLTLTNRVQKLMYLQSMAEHPEDAEKPVALFDMDGVLFDFDARVEAELTKAGIAIPPRLDFYMTKRLSDPTHIELIKDLQHSQGFFASLEPIPGSVEAWHYTESLGFHPRICSAPIRNNPWSIKEKLERVEDILGPRAADEAYIGKNKSDCSGAVLFDDRPIIADASQADWRHVLFTQEYNRHIETDARVNGWSDLTQVAHILAQHVSSRP